MIDPTIDCDTFEGTKRLTDEELLARLHKLMRKDRLHTARLLVHLGEVDARGLYRDQAYSSMHVYAVEALGLSDAEANLRIRAARLVRKFPNALNMFEREELHLSGLGMLSKILSPENHEALLAQARNATKAEIEQLVARHCPQADAPSFIRKLVDSRTTPVRPVATPSASVKPLPQSTAPRLNDPPACPATKPSGSTGPAASRLGAARAHGDGEERARANAPGAESDGPLSAAGECAPFRLEHPRLVPFTLLSPGRYKVQFTATETLQNKLQQAQDLLRRQVPNGDLAPIVDRAIDLLIAQLRKQHFAVTAKPQRTRGRSSAANRSRYIPAQVRREVAERDREQCSYVSPEGRRCPERAQLEFDHCNKPFARGGETKTANLRLLCPVHNRLEAEKDYGRRFIRQRIQAKQRLKASVATNQENAPDTNTIPNASSSSIQSFSAPATSSKRRTTGGNAPLGSGSDTLPLHGYTTADSGRMTVDATSMGNLSFCSADELGAAPSAMPCTAPPEPREQSVGA